jgi:hypothetical protein
MMIPTIHLNGTSPSSLFDDLMDAINAIRQAEEAVAKTAPSARDYYPQGPQAIGIATKEHSIRLEKLAQVREELEQIADTVSTAL